VILELINSAPVQRLKEIDQAGYFEPYFPGSAHSRFEHSLGVFLLLKQFRAPIEEQIAGLIHDVSHSAFSHCADYAIEGVTAEAQTFQDDIFDEFVKHSTIPAILKKYNFDLDFILDDKNFPLKESDLPDLCADRIDYALRTAVVLKKINDGKYFINSLLAENGKWIFQNFESAKKFAELFFELNRDYLSGLPSAIMFRTVGDYLRYALSRGYISETDLFTTDKVVLAKIETYHQADSHLRLLFERMNGRIGVKNNPENFDAKVTCKSRIVDPCCYNNGKVSRLSEIEPEWLEVVKQELRPKEYFLKFDR
jgi:hypothetical protein